MLEAAQDAEAAASAEVKKAAADSRQKELDDFVAGLSSYGSSKQDTFDAVTNFLDAYLKVPAVYVAVKKVAGESETLNYISANSSQANVVGKVLKKPAEEDGDDIPARQGCSFEAFKLPVVEEPEEVELEEGEEPPPPPPAPVPQPLVIDNVMRDSRIQFFGIPKLGSYVAVPFSYKSCDHSTGCMRADAITAPEGEEGELVTVSEPDAPYVKNYITVSLIIGSDTIGEFRRYSKKDVEIFKLVGEAMLLRLKVHEDTLFNQQVAFLANADTANGPLSALIAGLAEEEAAGKLTVFTNQPIN